MIGAHRDLLDRRGDRDAQLRDRQLGPGCSEIGGAPQAPLLLGGRSKVRGKNVKEPSGVGEKLADAEDDQLLDLAGRDAQTAGYLVAGGSDQRSRDVIAISRSLLDGMGWDHAMPRAVEQQSG